MLETLQQTLIDNLEREMNARGWKKTDLARASELSPSTIYPIWDKRVWPQPQTLSKLASGLGISVASLVSEGHLVTHKQALDILAESVSVASKLGSEIVAMLAALEVPELNHVRSVLMDLLDGQKMDSVISEATDGSDELRGGQRKRRT